MHSIQNCQLIEVIITKQAMKSYSSSCVIAVVSFLLAVDLASDCEGRPITCPVGAWGDDCTYSYPVGLPRRPPTTHNPTPVVVTVPNNPTLVVVLVSYNSSRVGVSMLPCPQP